MSVLSACWASSVVRSRMGMRCRMVILSGPMRTSLTSSRSTRWRSSTVEISALVVELGEEAFEVGGEFEVGLAVGELGVECLDLVVQVGFPCAQVGHAGAQFVDGDQLLAECLDHARRSRCRLWPALFPVVCVAVTAGSAVRAVSRRLSISVRISWGSASIPVMWSQTTVSR